MKVLVLGDVGGVGGYHLGDEAMAEAAVAALAARTDLEPVLVSGDVAETEARYGWSAVAGPAFPAGRNSDADREARLAAILSAADGESTALAWDDVAWPLIHAVAEADAVVISGGGNLNSLWPEHVYQRALVGLLAERFSTPLVVAGQTVGPMLTGRHGELVARLLGGARVVAVREQRSAELVRDLGVPQDRIVSVVDDATFLEPAPVLPQLEAPYVVCSLAGYVGALPADAVVDAVAGLLAHAAARVGGPVVFVAHHGGDAETGDAEMHRRIAARLDGTPVQFLDALTAREAVGVIAGAALLLTSRYHGLVFACGNGVPTVALASDDYTTQKLVGFAEQFGTSDAVLSMMALGTAAARQVVDELLDRSDDLRKHLAGAGAARRAEQDAWWDRALRSIGTAQPEASAVPATVESFALAAGGEVAALRAWSAGVAAAVTAASLSGVEQVAAVSAERARVDELRRELAEISADLDDKRQQIEGLEAELEASHRMMSEAVGPLIARLDEQPTVAMLQRRVRRLRRELRAIRSSRSYRVMEPGRRVVRRLRRH